MSFYFIARIAYCDASPRKTTTNWAFGSHEYSDEELIAKMTSSFLCGFAGIGEKTMLNSAAYIGGCLKKLQADPRCIDKAGSKAQRAADYTSMASAKKTPVDPGFLHVCMLSCLPDGVQTCWPVIMLAWFHEIMFGVDVLT